MGLARLLLVLAFAAALLLPAAMPVLADEDDEGDGEDDGDRQGRDGDRGNGNGQGRGADGGRGDDREGDGRGNDDKDKDKKDDKDKAEGKHGDDDDDGDEGRAHERRAGKRPGDIPTPGVTPADPGLRVSQDYTTAPGVMTYLFTVRNAGPTEARDVRLQGEVPDAASWILADPVACDLEDGAVACAVGDLTPGESRTVAVQGVLAGALPAFTNVVQVYTPLGDGADGPSSP